MAVVLTRFAIRAARAATRMASRHEEPVTKQIELLKEVVPGVCRARWIGSCGAPG